MLFFAVFFVFFNTGPSNTAIANVTLPSIRATGFALNILVIHALGDAIAPPLIGAIAGRTNLDIAFLFISLTMLIAGAIWLAGMKYLARDTAAVEEAALLEFNDPPPSPRKIFRFSRVPRCAGGSDRGDPWRLRCARRDADRRRQVALLSITGATFAGHHGRGFAADRADEGSSRYPATPRYRRDVD